MQEGTHEFYLSRAGFIQCRKASIRDFYQFEEQEIGKGTFGIIYRAKLKHSGKIRAVKKIQKRKIKYPQTFINEIETLKRLDHPNILKIYETFEDSDSYFIVTDICEGGDLFDRLSSHPFSEVDVQSIFKQLLYALNYCHREKIAHRDLKLENFLLASSEGYDVKIIDFGEAFSWKNSMKEELSQLSQSKLVGTCYYMAPEVIEGKYDQNCDIWSLGVVLYILLSTVPPFNGKTDQDILKAVEKGQYTCDVPQMKYVSAEAKDLIARMMSPVGKRISLEEVFQHPWLAGEVPNLARKLNFGKMIKSAKSSKLKKFLVYYMVSEISHAQFHQLSLIFRDADYKKDGYISLQELERVLSEQKHRISAPEMEEVLLSLDLDRNGKLNYSQFLAALLSNSLIFKQENVKLAFLLLDKDGNGKISKEELKQAFKRVNAEMKSHVMEEIMEEADKNHDGQIDFNEFMKAMSEG